MAQQLFAADSRLYTLEMSKGDLVKELSEACQEAGMAFGIYLSPWDQHAASYGTGQAYNEVYVGQLTELLTQYGEIAEVWLDGANGEGPNGKRQFYDWQRYYQQIRQLQPDAVMRLRSRCSLDRK
mgnify:CR=1 FL=1